MNSQMNPHRDTRPVAGLYVVETLFTVLATVAVGLRLWARRLTKRRLAFNDWAVIAALIGNFGFAATAYVAFTAGMGKHLADLENPEHDIIVISKCLLAFEALWAFVNVAVKVSILALYLDLFPGKWFKLACRSTMFVSFCLLVIVMFQVGFLCRPFEYNWNKEIEGSCGDTNQAYEAVGVINLITDLTIVILPMPALWGLQIPAGKKVALTFMFGVGALICVISILRVLSLAIWQSADFTYGMRQVGYWSMLEPTLGIINCCLPIMGPIISKVLSTRLWTFVTRRDGSSGYSGKRYSTGGMRISGKNNSNRHDDVEAGSFKRLHGPVKEYRLDDLERGVHRNDISTGSTGSGSQEFGLGADEKRPTPKEPRIAVKHEWNVKHTDK